jgi:phosphate starvation-inducible PhoH-like protein
MAKRIRNTPDLEKSTEKNLEERVIRFSIKEEIKLKPNQEAYLNEIKKNTITICTGPAGTAKTFIGCMAGLQLLKENKISKIVTVKPIKESGEEIGFLPGDVDKKIDPYFESFITNFTKILGPGMDVATLIKRKLIETRPVSYMRGISLDNCLIFLDEAQNLEIKSLMLLVTRLGHNSKMIISGDITQYDIKRKDVVLHEFIKMVDGIDSIGHFEFQRSDIVRNKLLIAITDKYDEYRESGIIKLS